MLLKKVAEAATFNESRGGCLKGDAKRMTENTESNTEHMTHGSEHVVAMGDANRMAKFQIGQVVKHRYYPFRGVIFDVDPTFSNTEEWWLSIPEEIRPTKDQPYYHLFAENEETEYIAYVSEQNLLEDINGGPVRHPQVKEYFDDLEDGVYRFSNIQSH